MATNVPQTISDELEKQPSVSKKEKYGQSARKVHKKKNDPRRIAAKQFLLGIASNVNFQTRPTSLEAEIRSDGDAINDNQNQWNSNSIVEHSAKLGQQSLTSSFGNDAIAQSISECKVLPSRHPVVRSFSNIESPSQRRKVMAHAKWNTYAEGSSLSDFPSTYSTSKARYDHLGILVTTVCMW